jgi:hypothetical protein
MRLFGWLRRKPKPVEVNPFQPKSWNLTQQMKMMLEHPARAWKLAQEARPTIREVNPFQPKSWNVTRQMQMVRENPALAWHLAQEAGATNGWQFKIPNDSPQLTRSIYYHDGVGAETMNIVQRNWLKFDAERKELAKGERHGN